MKAIQFDRLGGPEVMELREVPKPELQPGTVVVKNRVIALNYGDIFFIQGQYLVKPVFPDTPGMEAAGVIEAVAPDVKGLMPGMRVAYIGMGAYAEFTRMRASRVIPIPDATTLRAGGGISDRSADRLAPHSYLSQHQRESSRAGAFGGGRSRNRGGPDRAGGRRAGDWNRIERRQSRPRAEVRSAGGDQLLDA